jgi:hypothetical protein
LNNDFQDFWSWDGKSARYVLLGHGDRTVLVLFATVRRQMRWPMGLLADKLAQYETTVSIYSLDMLDEI